MYHENILSTMLYHFNLLQITMKLCSGFLQEELVQDLLKECAKMMEMNHPNVLALIGVCLDGGPAPYIVIPFMANGSLLSYLKKERKNLTLDSPSDDVITVQFKT